MARQAPVIKTAIFDGLVQFVTNEDMDLDVSALLAEVGLDQSVLEVKDAYVPLEAVSRFFERAASITRRPCFGLEYSRVYPVGATGSLGYILTNAPTFQTALNHLIRFLSVMTHPMHITFHEADGGVGYVEWLFPLEYTAVMPQYVSFSLGAVIERLRVLAGKDWTPLRVELIHRELPCTDLTRQMFGSRVRYETSHNRMWVDPTTRALRNPGADDRLYRVALKGAELELKSIEGSKALGTASVRTRLREHITAIMAEEPPTLDRAATALEMEPRQLQYVLDQLKTSFLEEVSETRKVAAESMLTNTEMSMTEIAAALGFSELSSFTRACREAWFGLSPSKFRQRVKAEGIVVTRADTSGEDWSERD